MGVTSLPKTVTRQRRDCDLNPGPSAPESSTLIAKFYYMDTESRTRARHGPDTDKVRARCRVRAKFHYTDTDTGTDTDTDFFAAKLRWVRAGPCQCPYSGI